MTKNPFINALAAILYISAVASLMFYATNHKVGVNSVLVPITVVSLFTLSAAVMGFLFFYQPLQLYLDGNKKQGAMLFLHTLGCFAVITILSFFVILSGIL